MQFENIYAFTYQKTLLHALLLFVTKIIEGHHCILKLPKKLFYLLQQTPFKNDEKCLLFHLLKLFSFSRYLNFCLGVLVM